MQKLCLLRSACAGWDCHGKSGHVCSKKAGSVAPPYDVLISKDNSLDACVEEDIW
jgi:hypothetical protein